jgi:membrane protein YqaA with SNARE-associated domain
MDNGRRPRYSVGRPAEPTGRAPSDRPLAGEPVSSSPEKVRAGVMLRKMYDWCLGAAGKPHASWALGAVSFAESSFFPIPPDTMLIPMALARPDKAYYYAALCTITSVAGGILGYAIGAFLYDSVGLWLIGLYGYGDKVEAFREAYAQWGSWIILIKGATPIPYKIVTITSGFAGYNFLLFVLLSIVTRGARFFLSAFLLNRYGPQARAAIEKRLGFWFTVFLIVFIVGIVAALYII